MSFICFKTTKQLPIRGVNVKNFKFKVFVSSIIFVIGLFVCLFHFIQSEDYGPKDGDITYLLKGKDFTNGKWELVIDNYIDCYMYVTDRTILEKFKNAFYIVEERAPYFSTPNYTVTLYKEGNPEDACSVDNLDKIQYKGLDKYLIKVRGKYDKLNFKASK